jgi:hypothetical protein
MPEVATSALTPGVALTSVVIYWGSLQSRLNGVSDRLRSLNTEMRDLVEGAARTVAVAHQVKVLVRRTRVLHGAAIMSVATMVAFLVSSAALFLVPHEIELRRRLATQAFIIGLATFGASLAMTLWEMLLARAALETDVAASQPRPAQQHQQEPHHPP